MSYQSIAATVAPIKAEDSPLARLLAMLAYRRPSRSRTERKFINRYIVPTGAKADEFGNYWLKIGETKVIWTSHTDSVHRAEGRQPITFENGIATAPKSSCLGADCAVGVWLMCEMISAKVPGLYIFHRDEESGGQGSRWIAKNFPQYLGKFQFAIAFDRKARHSVITHQMGGYCASQAFVDSIAPMLPGAYRADDGGVYTDTAEYMGLIGECTNLSVGYDDEHTKWESLNVAHALALRESMVAFDESRLVCSREPGECDAPYRLERDFSWGAYLANENKPTSARASAKAFQSSYSHYYDLLDLCRRSPDLVADFLEQLGHTVDDVMLTIK